MLLLYEFHSIRSTFLICAVFVVLSTNSQFLVELFSLFLGLILPNVIIAALRIFDLQRKPIDIAAVLDTTAQQSHIASDTAIVDYHDKCTENIDILVTQLYL